MRGTLYYISLLTVPLCFFAYCYSRSTYCSHSLIKGLIKGLLIHFRQFTTIRIHAVQDSLQYWNTVPTIRLAKPIGHRCGTFKQHWHWYRTVYMQLDQYYCQYYVSSFLNSRLLHYVYLNCKRNGSQKL